MLSPRSKRVRALRTRAALGRARLAALLRRARLMFLADPGPAVEQEVAVTGAQVLLEAASSLRGGAAKVAQLMAYLQDPEREPQQAAQALLGTLFDRLPGSDPAGIRRVVQEDLGRPPEQIFAVWEEAPMAAASLGQVHGARGLGGEDLAVKVQYPQVAEALLAELDNQAILRELSGAALGGGLPQAALSALRDAILRECDYREEARFQERFRRLYRPDPQVVIPRIFADFSSRRVLTAERLRGQCLLDFARSAREQARQVAALCIFRVAFGAPLVHGLLNADPNPGNFLVLGDGRVGFVDFGCCIELDERVVRCEQVLWQALLAGDAEALRYTFCHEGLVREPIELDSDRYRAWERCLHLPFATPRFRTDPGYARELALHTSALVRGGRFTLPRELVLLWRQRLGLWAVLGQLRAEGNFRGALLDLLREVDMAPAGVT
ncbi:MAG: AarF/UbiB family protein [Myxococcales bacterium]|nr:AarF/UbiB family protein [Myxococcota bacterium]MDW8281510.1 AarF/UbiB family protein [Myxococcales bacterium]